MGGAPYEVHSRFWQSVFHSVASLCPIWGGLAILISLVGVWMARLEGLDISDGLYFAWITATTVGYGDISPTRGLSQFAAIFDALLGITLTGIIVSIALSAAKLSIQKNGSLDSLSDTAKQRMAQKVNEQSQAKKDDKVIDCQPPAPLSARRLPCPLQAKPK